MTFDRYLEVKALSRFAAEMEPAARRSFVRRACEGNQELREQVELFIALHRKTADGGGVKKDERGFVGRHKAGVAALIALALLGALAVVLWQAGAA
jgi:hypothetical protein